MVAYTKARKEKEKERGDEIITYLNLWFRLNPHGIVRVEYSKEHVGLTQTSYNDWSFYKHAGRRYPKLYTTTLVTIPSYRCKVKRLSGNLVVIIGDNNRWALEIKQAVVTD